MSDRVAMPDRLRLVALFGIVAVNIQFVAFPFFTGPDPAGALDAAALWLVNGLALLKTYGLFSFMVGVGLGFQIDAARRRGLRFGPLYRNRMIGLALLGLAHGCLFFPGDILVTYALAGGVLYLWRGWAPRRLAVVGACFVAAQVLLSLALLALPDEPPLGLSEIERAAMTEGGFLDAVALRAAVFAVALPFLLLFQGFAALGWFCLGLAAVRTGMIADPDHPLWARARRVLLAPGVGLSLLGAALWEWGDAALGEALTVLVAPLATLGYLGLIAAWTRAGGRLPAALARAGGSSLSVYLGQSVALSTIFSGYGLGLWNAIGPAAATAVALLVTAALIAALALWRARFAHGPFEWLLRAFTRLGARPVDPTR